MWPTMILINYMTGWQLYSLYKCMGENRQIRAYRHMRECTDAWGQYRCMGCTDTGGHIEYGSIWMYGRCRYMGHMDLGVYGCIWMWGGIHTWEYMDKWGAYGCTSLPTTPEGICKKFSFPLIKSLVHHLSTEMEGKKPTKCLNVHLLILTQTIQQNNWWIVKNWRKRKEHKQFTKIGPYFSLHYLGKSYKIIALIWICCLAAATSMQECVAIIENNSGSAVS